MNDMLVTCKEENCGKEFTITAREQEFYAFKKLDLPKRCPDCRAKRKAAAKSPFNGLKEASTMSGQRVLKNGIIHSTTK